MNTVHPPSASGQLPPDLDPRRLPAHVAVIMDGNGRWAEERGWPRFLGHRQGVEALNDIVRCCKDWGVAALTVYAFSTENWGRPVQEVNFLMTLFHEVLERELRNLVAEGVQLRFMGDLAPLPKTLRHFMEEAMSATAHNQAVHFNVAMNYGGRQEILHAVQAVAHRVEQGELKAAAITEQDLTEHLYTHPTPDPDLLIRSSGELRLSNFLLWQLAYTELYVADVFWPDFDRACFHKALLHYQTRKRRFGRLDLPT
ncbi:isoprenyl transferase [Candidatus Cyanaurora vandensis]|uniref:isoprenyl transferase n=1 Tax=Candidatus Cyanaurora vandensis TaxID=2714958 RepID=UPI00257EC930|nr:isoprenyl transferase [Candidatus Cyanaurora vandensis]